MDTQSKFVNRLLLAKGLRAFGDGYVSLLLPLHLLGLGFSPLHVGIIATTTLAGSGLLTLAVGLHAWRFHARSLLLAASVLMAATGFGFAVLTDFWPLLLIALVGTLNPSSGDVSVFLPLEHAVLSGVVSDRQRTATFARYSLVGALLAAVGSLAAALPATLASISGMSSTHAMQAMFLLYALLACASGLVYRGLPRVLATEERQPVAPLQQSKRNVYTLAALFSLDAFAGGFVVQSMVALWLYQRFGLSLAAAGAIFFWTGVLTAASYLVAVRVAGEHEHHLGEERRGQRDGPQEAHALTAIGGGLQRLLLRAAVGVDHSRAVAGFADGFHQRLRIRRAGRVFDARPRRREIDVGRHARKAIERLLDARGAGGAGHAFDGEVDPAGRHVEAGPADALDEIGDFGRARLVVDASALGGEVDRGLHAGHFVQTLFEAGCAGSAGHAGDGQLDRSGCEGCVHGANIPQWGIQCKSAKAKRRREGAVPRGRVGLSG